MFNCFPETTKRSLHQNSLLKPPQMSKQVQPIYFISLFFTLFRSCSSELNSDEERATLLRLKQHWQNPSSLNAWNASNSSHCEWPEVNCIDRSITSLDLANRNITGTIPSFIVDLKNLSALNFSYNNIVGNFPVALYNLSNLEYLDLSQNYFVGPIPDSIDSMDRLSSLHLYANNFSGDIPAAIGRLQQLRELQLHQNQFDGTFPDEIGNLSNLEILYMAYNAFSPSRLPSSFTKLKNLRYLWMSEANLIGEMPDMIGEMLALENLDLSINSLTGHIPGGLFMLKNLNVLYLYQNKLSGDIPQVIEALNLIACDVSQNNLTGRIPDDFGNLEKLRTLFLFFNQLSGDIPESIGRLPALTAFRSFNNNLSGTLPPDFGRYSPLKEFQVAVNRHTGRLPEYLCNAGKLVGVAAFENNLSGELPESLSKCSSLKYFEISNNAFTGEIPPGLWSAPELELLMMSDNMFTGELPNEVASNLLRLEISNNRFSGRIPVGVGSSWNLVVFKASNNSFTGTIPQELTALPNLTTLLLDQNQLSGSLPSDIISWKSLNFLNLSQNHLSGQIPEDIGFLPVLGELDLSDNQFSGQIPSQIGFLRLTSLNLSSNHLIGKIPREFENAAYSSSFLGNPGLCASRSVLNLNVCDSRPQKSRRDSTLFLASIITSSLVIAFMSALLLILIVRIRRKKRDGSSLEWTLTSFQKLNFTEKNILPGLTESNVIGSGASGKVYRVTTNQLNQAVAVKRISSNGGRDHKLEKLFHEEVETLSNIKHSNIVKLLCCISNGNTMLLVYEYVHNRSLDRWLHTKRRATSISGSVRQAVLDWPKRMQIAVGAAQGLCHMHQECSPPIVHRDMKSSNILLDSNFNAKIADFGVAKLLNKEGELATVSAVLGSFGYIAPEYARTPKVNEKIDVYSFGVVLLELTTGKEANYGDETSGLAEWAWRHMRVGKPITDALDKEVLEPCHLDEMSCVFKLGLRCTVPFPNERPSMREVLQILLRSSRPLVYGVKTMASHADATPLLGNSNSKRLSDSDDDSNLASIV